MVATNGSAPTRLHGVSLRRYAEISATLAEGFPLDVVLERERLDQATWSRAELAWMDRLQEDEQGALQEDLDRHTEAAQTRLTRRIPPLDEDLKAWLDFVRIWSAEAQPLSLIGDLGLRPSDLVRLHRFWSKRLEEDRKLQQRAMSILAETPRALPIPRPAAAQLPPPLPPEPVEMPVEVAQDAPLVETAPITQDLGEPPPPDPKPALLTPLPPPPPRGSGRPAGRSSASRLAAVDVPIRRSGSSASRLAVDAPIVPSQSPSPAPAPPTRPVVEHDPLTNELSLLEYAHVCAEIQVSPERSEAVFAKYGLADATKREATNRAWQARLQANPDEMADFVAIHTRSIKHWKLFNKK